MYVCLLLKELKDYKRVGGGDANVVCSDAKVVKRWTDSRSRMMEVQQQHSPVGVGPLDFSRRGVAEASAFRVVKPKQPASSLVHQQPLPPETNNNENVQENPQIPIDEGEVSSMIY